MPVDYVYDTNIMWYDVIHNTCYILFYLHRICASVGHACACHTYATFWASHAKQVPEWEENKKRQCHPGNELGACEVDISRGSSNFGSQQGIALHLVCIVKAIPGEMVVSLSLISWNTIIPTREDPRRWERIHRKCFCNELVFMCCFLLFWRVSSTATWRKLGPQPTVHQPFVASLSAIDDIHKALCHLETRSSQSPSPQHRGVRHQSESRTPKLLAASSSFLLAFFRTLFWFTSERRRNTCKGTNSKDTTLKCK